ncbi:carbohydrate binding domain-containing protein [Paenibacillus elgii]
MEKRVISFLLCIMLMITYVSPTMAASEETKYQYDTRGQLVEASNSNGTIYHEYDANGNRIRKYTTNNLLTNFSFETYTGTNGVADGWLKYVNTGINGGLEVVSSPVSSGTKAQKISATVIPSGGLNVHQQVKVDENTTYTVSGKMKTELMSNAQVEVVMFYFDINGTVIGSSTPVRYTGNTDWITFNGQFTTPANTVKTTLYVHLSTTSSNGAGTVYLDFMKMVKGADPNLLSNSDFETYTGTNGVADGWLKYVNTGINGGLEVVSSPVSSGTKAQKISATVIPSGGLNVHQQVKVDENTTYTVSGKMKTELMSNAQVEVVMFYFDINGTLVGNATPVRYTGNTDWITFNGQFTTPANTVKTTLYVHLSTTSSNGAGTVYLDFMKMVKGADPNLLSNSDFETYTGTNGVADGWLKYVNTGINGGLEVVSSPVSSGTKAQKISATVIPSGGLNVHQQVKVDENTTYTVSGKMKTELMSNAQVEVVMFYFDINGTLVGNATPVRYTGNTDWITFNGQFTTPANTVKTTLYVHLSTTSSNGAGTVYLDFMKMVKGADPNLLSNSDFETYTGTNGVADGWLKYVNTGINGGLEVVSSPVASGTKAQKISATVIPSGGLNVHQQVKVDENATYTVSGKMKTELMSNAQVEVVMFYFDINGTVIGSSTPVRYTGNTDWITFNGQFTTPANTVKTTLYVHLSTTSSNGAGTVYLDSMKMVKGADPNLLSNSDFETYTGTNGVADGWIREHI